MTRQQPTVTIKEIAASMVLLFCPPFRVVPEFFPELTSAWLRIDYR
jgi:hypothetical protein